MFVLVRFFNEFDGKVYVVPVRCIKDFHPLNENDFDKNGVYTTYWEDLENSENTGSYSSQVLLLASSKEELEAKRALKRVRKAIIHPSDLEQGEGSEHDAPASQKQSSKLDSRQTSHDKKRPKALQLASEFCLPEDIRRAARKCQEK
ncbi:BEN domain-containing protein 5-like [Ixodes scapularis]|uniref:BEN domain-containing protein 5-like n=1 Tax=Ixodes scapularis TaxID=6945 RepID=UPI001C387DE4|nr:BEN domain-containing protein 5-like [Ixodes scapularis]